MKNEASIRVDKEKLSQLFRNERIKIGLSKQEIIKLCQGKIGKTTLVSIEYGSKESYREDTLSELAKVFNISFEALLNKVNKGINDFSHDINQISAYKNADSDMQTLFSSPFSVHSPNQNDLRWIEMIEKKIYGEFVTNTVDQLSCWNNKNSNSITVMKDKNQKVCGYLTLLPVKDDVYERFLAGDIFDKEINSENIYSNQEKNKIKYIYVESFLVIDNNFDVNILGITEYLKNTPKLFADICLPSQNITVFSIIGKKGDEVLLNELGFSRLFVPVNSRTKFDVFYIQLETLLANIAK